MEKHEMDNLNEDVSESESYSDSDEEEAVKLAEPSKNAVYNTDGLNDKLQDISWPENVPWIHKLTIDIDQEQEVDVNDDLARELSFYTQALEGTRKAFEKLESMGLPFLRPADYYAEMVKSDSHMVKVKGRLLAEKKNIEEAEERRKAREAKRLAKEIQAQKQKERAAQKKSEIESVKKWRKQRQQSGFAGGNKNGEVDLPFEDGKVFERSSKKRPGVAPGDRSGGKTKQFSNRGNKKQMKREKRDSKFGYGGRKGLKKQNTAETTGDFRSFNKNSAQGNKKRKRVKIIEACVISVITSVISFGLPLLRRCSPCPESDSETGVKCPQPPGTYGNYVNFFCSKDNEYNDLATIFFNTQDDAIRNLFSAKTINEYSAQSLLTFLVMFYTLAVVTFGTAVPAGQFVPGIMIGSTYGRLVGMFVVKYYAKLNIEEGTYALLGAASFLGGSMRITVSLCVIMVEITNNLKFLPLIMLVLLISKAVGDAFNEGLYDEQARLRHVPLLESRPKYEMRKITAKEACGNQKVVSFPRIAKVADIVSILRSNKHNGFPVVDYKRNGETLVIGLVLRSHLLVLLQSKVDFQHSPLPCDPTGGSSSIRHNFSEFVKPVSSKGLSIEDIHLGSDDLEMYIDLAPFLNPSPYVVPEDMSLTKVYNLFRELGLRHLFVVPRASRVIGLITRKDLLIEENEDTSNVELQSTSVRGRNRAANINPDAERPLLNGLLAQDRGLG